MADQAKATHVTWALAGKGNAAFSAGNYEEAITHFTEGIKLDPSNHVLFSNRSAAHASLKQYREALDDATKVTEMKPEWGKGFSRLGAANVGLRSWDAAVDAYTRALQLDPQNQATKQQLEEAMAGRASSRSPAGGAGGLGGLFGPDFMAKLATNPQTRSYLADPSFMQLLQSIQSNPQNLNMALADPRFQQAMSVGLGMNIMTGDQFAKDGAAGAAAAAGADDEEMPDPEDAEEIQTQTTTSSSGAGKASASASATTRQEPKAQPSAPPTPEIDEDAKQEQSAKQQAQKEKEAGNAAYKAKNFDEAIKHYDAAIELDDTDISFVTNRAAVHFEKGDYDACIADCEKAVERGRELRLDYKLIAKALTRKGNALVKQDRLEEAVEAYHKALTEHRNPDTLKKLNETEKALKQRKEQEYINVDLSNEEREKGNQAFKDQKYPEAVQHYTEALKRGPPSVNPEAYKLYSNRAASYTKLLAFGEGLKDAEETIRLAPTFAKGYSRKGHLQFFMKDYDKAMATYQAGLEADPENEELKDGIRRCLEAISQLNSGQASEEEVKQRQARAMQDPEIQNILTDPIMRQVLDDLQNDPKSSQQHLKQPQIMAKLQKLVSAGIVQMR